MGKATGISWVDSTWNPWQGCSKVSLGCKYCYMYREKRAYGQDPATVIRSRPATFKLPLKLEAGKRVFVCSWSDFFHEAADPWRAEAWEIINARRDLTFIIPTHRIERAASLLPWPAGYPWPHVWVLVSASTQREAGKAIAMLLTIPGAVRGVSLEPLLEAINLCGLTDGRVHYSALAPGLAVRGAIDWVIVAGESGGPPERALVEKWEPPGPYGWHTKPEAVEWVRAIRDQCQKYQIPFHFKGWGGPKPTSGGRLLDGRENLDFPAE